MILRWSRTMVSGAIGRYPIRRFVRYEKSAGFITLRCTETYFRSQSCPRRDASSCSRFEPATASRSSC